MTRGGHATWWKRAAVAAAVLGAVLGGLAVGRALAPDVPPHPLPSPPPTTPAAPAEVDAATDTGSSVRLTAAVTPEPGWIRVRAAVLGAPPGQRYDIVLRTRSGAEITVAAWIGSPEHELDGVSVDGTAAVPRDDLASIAVVGADGRRYVTVTY
ncbi:hypothetical protein [Actinokineospora fastidiosa]|uniref:Anti-sigma factor n=1 Tax=Actinokineospora fastidiosa TaxID=1816 RepID=A0A918G7E8_9PSEU|nr:hypothetical protein [Actinokineospora fastidiosa]GGS19542.1 hypothetical protein GCM10010171_10160 [Actinokineospora fastidiosa]